MTDGSAPARALTSISSKRGSARSRKDCPSCAQRIVEFPPSLIRSGASSNCCRWEARASSTHLSRSPWPQHRTPSWATDRSEQWLVLPSYGSWALTGAPARASAELVPQTADSSLSCTHRHQLQLKGSRFHSQQLTDS